MKNAIIFIIFYSMFSSTLYANKPARNYVNFYTLAANQPSLDGNIIALKGWVYFAKYKNHEITYLFPSEESMNYFTIQEAVTLKLNATEFKTHKKNNDRKFVLIEGQYHQSEEIHLFGYLDNITIIHKRLVPKK